ncbi:EpsG family protein [Caproicibacter sp.]|uniref:EpsG family protein n=1 Tax=Caproicibacter sp. TaxID=2814884 RepID=UPI003988E15F
MDFYSSMIFYGIIGLLTALNAECSVRSGDIRAQGFFACNAILIPSLTAGFRYGIGTDYLLVYYPEFQNLQNHIHYHSRMELGFVLLNRFVIALGCGFPVLLFLVSFLTILFVFLCLKQYRKKLSVGLGMLVFMLLYYQLSFDIMRQAAAMSIEFYALKYVTSRKLFRFSALTAFACCFHLSALILFPVYFAYFLYGKPKYQAPAMISYAALIFLVLNYNRILYPILGGIGSLRYYSGYLRATKSFSFSIGVFARTVPFLLPGFLLRRELKRDSRMFLLFNLLIMGCIFRLTAYTTVYFTERIAYYFLIPQIVLVPTYCRQFKEQKKTWISVTIFAFVFFLWIYDYFVMGSCQTVPYRSIFQ